MEVTGAKIDSSCFVLSIGGSVFFILPQYCARSHAVLPRAVRRGGWGREKKSPNQSHCAAKAEDKRYEWGWTAEVCSSRPTSVALPQDSDGTNVYNWYQSSCVDPPARDLQLNDFLHSPPPPSPPPRLSLPAGPAQVLADESHNPEWAPQSGELGPQRGGPANAESRNSL